MLLVFQGPGPSEPAVFQGQDPHKRKQDHLGEEWKCSLTSEDTVGTIAGKSQEPGLSSK